MNLFTCRRCKRDMREERALRAKVTGQLSELYEAARKGDVPELLGLEDNLRYALEFTRRLQQ